MALSSARPLWAGDQCVLLPIILECPLAIATSLFRLFSFLVEELLRTRRLPSSCARVQTTPNWREWERIQRAFICFIPRHHLISDVPTLHKAFKWSRRTSVSRPQLKRTACFCASLIYPKTCGTRTESLSTAEEFSFRTVLVSRGSFIGTLNRR